jgi:hypothetical protein
MGFEQHTDAKVFRSAVIDHMSMEAAVRFLIAVIFAGATIARTNSPAPVPHFENTLIAVVNGRSTGCTLSCGKT